MRVGHFFTFQGVLPGAEARISGHVKIPMRAIAAQVEMGLRPELITTQFRPGCHLGMEVPDGVVMRQVTDARLRDPRAGRWQRAQVPLRVVQSLRELRKLVVERKFDVLHVWGATGTAEIGGLLAASGMSTKVVATIIMSTPDRPVNRPLRALLAQLDAVIASTADTQARLQEFGLKARLIRQGTVQDTDIADPGLARPRNRVLFWREMTWSNGGDLCVEMFRRLAPRYPETIFTLAVRDSGEPELPMSLPDLPNVESYRAPYTPGKDLATLMSEALCVVQPMRLLSMNPQLAVIESLAAGVPVVASDIGSNGEYIIDQITGALVPPDDPSALTAAVESLIQDPARAADMGSNAAAAMRRYDWGEIAAQTLAVYHDIVR